MSARTSKWIYATLVAYVAGFLLFPPRALLIIDESQYVTQALAFAHGALKQPGSTPLHPADPLPTASDYPPGTSLLQTPFVAVAGWRGAAALSMISLVLATLFTMQWLREQQLEPRFALLVPAFVGSLFFGRIAMSDVPSAACVALALWALFRAEQSARWSFIAGLVAGGSVLLRETNAVILAPLIAGAFIRREGARGMLVLGVVLGVVVRLALSRALFGDALYLRDSGFGFSLSSVGHNLVQYGLLLLLFVPLGAFLPFYYQGPRRAEMVVSFWAYLAVFLCYDYGGSFESGRIKGLILVSRYLVPLLPLLAFMAADVWPQWVALASRRWQTLTRRAMPPLLSGVVAMAFLVHPTVRRQERAVLPIIQAIDGAADRGIPVITNHHATLKYLSPVYGTRPLILRSYTTPDDLPGFFKRLGNLNVVLLDRTDSEMFRADASENGAFLERAGHLCQVRRVHDAMYGGMRLHVYSIVDCAKR